MAAQPETDAATKRATILISLVVRLIRVKPIALAEQLLALMAAEEPDLAVNHVHHLHHLEVDPHPIIQEEVVVEVINPLTLEVMLTVVEVNVMKLPVKTFIKQT